MPNEILVVFDSGSNYNYPFIIKELANEFKGQFKCLWGNNEKYKTFSFPIEKETRNVDEDGNEDVMTTSCKIKFINSAINSARFMTNSLSNFVDNLAEGIHKITCKYCSCFLKYEIVNDNLIKYKYLSFNKNYFKQDS